MDAVKDKIDFKNNLDQVVVRIIKMESGNIIFLQDDNNFILDLEEQNRLVKFMSGNV